jgi:uncharacterized membrane protein YphA (DoxX/SURF4 family)
MAAKEQLRLGETGQGVVMLLARLLLAWVFIDSSIAKLLYWHESLDEIAALALPYPPLMLSLTVATQILGGLAVALGIGARLGALALAGFTLAATLLAHAYWGFDGAERVRQQITFLEHMAIIGGFLVLAVHGPGPWSFERIRLRRVPRSAAKT